MLFWKLSAGKWKHPKTGMYICMYYVLLSHTPSAIVDFLGTIARDDEWRFRVVCTYIYEVVVVSEAAKRQIIYCNGRKSGDRWRERDSGVMKHVRRVTRVSSEIGTRNANNKGENKYAARTKYDIRTGRISQASSLEGNVQPTRPPWRERAPCLF